MTIMHWYLFVYIVTHYMTANNTSIATYSCFIVLILNIFMPLFATVIFPVFTRYDNFNYISVNLSK